MQIISSNTIDFVSNSRDESANLHKVFTIGKISANKEVTPEGFLLCKNVPVARIGLMYYAPGEVDGLEAGPHGIIIVSRVEGDLFTEETMSSGLGKPITINHPDEHVDPSTYENFSKGTALNVRRGEGEESDLLLMDLLISSIDAINAIDDGCDEISLGYRANYEELSPGEYRQFNVVINHVALVESGRCGPRCAVKDSNEKVIEMAKNKVKTSDKQFDKTLLSKVIGWLTLAAATKDADGLAQVISDAASDEDLAAKDSGEPDDQKEYDTKDAYSELKSHIEQNAKEHEGFRAEIAALKEMLSKLTASSDDSSSEEDDCNDVKDEEMEEEVPGSSKTSDSSSLQSLFTEVLANAEILAPGVVQATFDKSASPKSTMAKIRKMRSDSLEHAIAADSSGTLSSLVGKNPVKGMSAMACRTAFSAAALVAANKNNQSVVSLDSIRLAGAGVSTNPNKKPLSLVDFADQVKEHYRINK